MERSAEHSTTDGRPRVRGVRCTALLLCRLRKTPRDEHVIDGFASGADLHINH
jgi:hypothetical protein